jgi:hypothetical protein
MMNVDNGRPPTEGKLGGDLADQECIESRHQNTPNPRAQDTQRDQSYWRCVCLARKLQRNNQLAAFEEELNSGSLDLGSPDFMRAAIALVRVKIGRNMPPTPTDAQLGDINGWIAGLMAERKRQTWAEKHSRELELLCRLESVIARHEAEHGGFERRQLNTNNPFYIRVEDGGISNMHIVCLANFIAGNNDERSFDDNCKIVVEFLAKRKAEGSR